MVALALNKNAKGGSGRPRIHCAKSQCPGAKKIGNQLHYIRNMDAYKERSRKQDTYPERKRSYFCREDVKEAARLRAREWASDNQERKASSDKQWREANRARDRANKARYRAAVRKATPPWLTDDHRSQILSFYEQADKLTLETGIEHEVDHIIPLQAGCACGLHVPWNLRVITRDDNNRRPRKWSWKTINIIH